MKPFDIEKAKAGAPVVTRDGRSVQIVCYDRKHETKHTLGSSPWPIVGLVRCADGEELLGGFSMLGRYSMFTGDTGPNDLFMAPQKKTRQVWVNVYREAAHSHNTWEIAERSAEKSAIAVAVPVTIEWEE